LLIALLVQNTQVFELIRAGVGGNGNNFLAGELDNIFSGGGLTSMLGVVLVVASVGALYGLFELIGLLHALMGKLIDGARSADKLIALTCLISFLAATLTCNQTLAIIIPGRLMRLAFKRLFIRRETLARTIADSGVVASAIILWCAAGLAPAIVLGVTVVQFAPFAIFCWSMPFFTILFVKLGKILLVNKPYAEDCRDG
jgi:NhaC family Na+:H+ antiporter